MTDREQPKQPETRTFIHEGDELEIPEQWAERLLTLTAVAEADLGLSADQIEVLEKNDYVRRMNTVRGHRIDMMRTLFSCLKHWQNDNADVNDRERLRAAAKFWFGTYIPRLEQRIESHGDFQNALCDHLREIGVPEHLIESLHQGGVIQPPEADERLERNIMLCDRFLDSSLPPIVSAQNDRQRAAIRDVFGERRGEEE